MWSLNDHSKDKFFHSKLDIRQENLENIQRIDQSLLFQEEWPFHAKNAMNTLFVCRCFGWARDNCFTKDLYRLLHVPKLHNMSLRPLTPSIFVIVSKVSLRCGLLNVDAWVFRCRCSIPWVRREEGVGGQVLAGAGHVLSSFSWPAGERPAGRDIGRWPLLVPLPVRPCL